MKHAANKKAKASLRSKKLFGESKKVVNFPLHSERSEKMKLQEIAYKVFEENPLVLSEEEEKALFYYLRLNDGRVLDASFQIGHCAFLLYRAIPTKRLDLLEEKFDQYGLDYKKAMSLKQFYLAYRKDPTEMKQYRWITAAILLSRFTTRKEREKVWKKTGSLQKLRKFFKKIKNDGDTKDTTIEEKDPIEIGNKWTKASRKLKVRYFKGILQLKTVGKGEQTQELEKLVSKLLGRPIHLVT